MTIRRAKPSDEESIRQLLLEAFDAGEAGLVADLACELLKEPTTPETVTLVAEEETGLVGHVAFSPVHSQSDDSLVGYILAPLAVRPSHQGKGIGRQLVERGFQELALLNAEVILVYGDPNYYSRFGFQIDLAAKYVPPFQLEHPSGWQCFSPHGENSDQNPISIDCVKALNKPELW